MKESIDFFNKAFNHEKARKEGVIIPKKGVSDHYDEAIDGIDEIKKQLEHYLNKQQKRLGCKVGVVNTRVGVVTISIFRL